MSQTVEIIDYSSDPPPEKSSLSFIQFMEKYRFTSLLIFTGLILLLIGGAYFFQSVYRSASQVTIVPVSSGPASGSPGIYIDLAGAVVKPGLYHLAVDSRVNDVLVAAGGLSVLANREWVNQNLNLSQKLTDGAKIYIPETQESGSANDQPSKQVAGASDWSSTKININTASNSQLETLPGIGPAMAGRITDYRNTNGSFTTVEDIKKVSGIGDKIFEEIKDKITVY
jgi:competence protein ComEA